MPGMELRDAQQGRKLLPDISRIGIVRVNQIRQASLLAQ